MADDNTSIIEVHPDDGSAHNHLTTYARKPFTNLGALARELQIKNYSAETADIDICDLLDSLDGLRIEEADDNTVKVLDAISFLFVVKINKAFWHELVSIIESTLLDKNISLLSNEFSDVYSGSLSYFTLAKEIREAYLVLRILNALASLDANASFFTAIFDKDFMIEKRDLSLHSFFYVELSTVHADIRRISTVLHKGSSAFTTDELGDRWRVLKNATIALNRMVAIPNDMANSAMSSDEYEKQLKTLMDHFSDIFAQHSSKAATSDHDEEDRKRILDRLDSIDSKMGLSTEPSGKQPSRDDGEVKEMLADILAHLSELPERPSEPSPQAPPFDIDQLRDLLLEAIPIVDEPSEPPLFEGVDYDRITSIVESSLETRLSALTTGSSTKSVSRSDSLDADALFEKVRLLVKEEHETTRAQVSSHAKALEGIADSLTKEILSQFSEVQNMLKNIDFNSEMTNFKEIFNELNATINRTHQIITELKQSDDRYTSIIEEKGLGS